MPPRVHGAIKAKSVLYCCQETVKKKKKKKKKKRATVKKKKTSLDRKGKRTSSKCSKHDNSNSK